MHLIREWFAKSGDLIAIFKHVVFLMESMMMGLIKVGRLFLVMMVFMVFQAELLEQGDK